MGLHSYYSLCRMYDYDCYTLGVTYDGHRNLLANFKVYAWFYLRSCYRTKLQATGLSPYLPF